MKIILIRLLSITFLLVGMNACVGPVGPAYGGGGYYDSGYSDGGGYGPTYIVDNDVAYYDTYGHYSSSYRPGYVRYYGHYDHNGRRDPHGYYSRSGRDLRSHSSGSSSHHVSSSSNHSSSKPLYTHKSSDNNRGAPQGQHTESWYKSRGYGVSKLQPANSSHSNNSRSSSHSKKDDDDHKHHR